MPRIRLGLGWLALALAATCVRSTAADRPNFVFILTDDQRFDALGCAGNAQVKTPNIDRLAAQGTRFRQHFITTPICCVSRASILTGQYERRHGIKDFSTPLTDGQWAECYPALLRAAGYHTGFIGKFGIGDAKAIAARAKDFDDWHGRPGQAGEWFIEPGDPTRTHATAKLGGEALAFLDQCTRDQPFCLSISFNAPHARDGKAREFEPDPRDESLYARTHIKVPKLATDEAFRVLPIFVQESEARRRWELRFATPELFQRTMRDYYRLISGVDREVGRIVARLAERGLARDTLIIFTSDNGWSAGERGLADKWFIYEESVRVPLVIFDPRLPQPRRGQSVDAITLNVDFAPTFVAMAGLQAPAGMQGRNLAPLWRERTPADWRTEFFFEHHFNPALIPPSEGIRGERWVYLRWLAPNPEIEELYDLRRDRLEQHNLAREPSKASILAGMRAQREHYARILR